MAIPTYEELMLPLLKLLSDKNTYTNKQCNEILAKQCNLTEQEKRETLPSKKAPIFYNRVNWAKTYMKKAGQATKKTGDGGIDGIINEDRLGLDSIYI